MNASYGLRLIALCFALYFLLNLVLSLAVRLAIPAVLRLVSRWNARPAANTLFALRLLPSAASFLFVLSLGLPSYLLLEPGTDSERLTLICVILASVGATVIAIALGRTAWVLLQSRRLVSAAKCECPHSENRFLVVKSDRPLVALAGLLRPQLLISEELLHGLTPEQLDIALRHEQAHHRAGDNLKRLAMMVSPIALPFSSGYKTLMRQFSKYTEWAADDDAISGDPKLGVALAEALMRVTRLGAESAAFASPLISTLVSEDCALTERVERLLKVESKEENVRSYSRLALIALAAAAIGIAITGLPSTLSVVHTALERFFG